MEPIGVVRSPFADKASAPRQASLAHGIEARIELAKGRGFEDALDGIDSWSHLWVIFAFHLSGGVWHPKVLPPRSSTKRGVFATRAPYRPNPIGMSVVRLVRVENLVLHVAEVDIVDGTPVLDIKPYVPYADSIQEAASGWLDAPADPGPRFAVVWSPRADEQRAFVREATGEDVAPGVETILAAGPEPHAYRRIRREPGGALRLSHKAWRYRFHVDGERIVIEHMMTGYRDRDLEEGGSELLVHREFRKRFEP
jgi:tRNA-Thr(GGU) m(6)t(6)A37 methyltransferase TsaA